MFTASQDQRVSGPAGTASADEGVGEAAEAALAAAWATDACCRVAGWGGHTADSPCSQTLRISACADRRGLTRPTKGWRAAADAAPAAAWATDTCCRGAWWSSRGRQLMFTASQDQRVSGPAGTASADEGVGEAAEAALAAAWATDACCRVAGWGGHTADSPCSQTLRISACADRRGRTRPTSRGIGAAAADAAPAAAWATDTCCRGAWWSSRGRQLMFTASQDQRVSGLAGTASTDEGVGEAAEAAPAAAWATDTCC